MKPWITIREALLHLAFPHLCEGCGTDVLGSRHLLCLRCLASLPATNFHKHAANPVEKLFWGRLPLTAATAQYYFTRESLVQELMHSFKYRGHKDLGRYLGNLMGRALTDTHRFSTVDVLLPLPLYRSRERKRGFNQAALLCDGIAEVMKKPVLGEAVIRNSPTQTQTTKNRIQRWQNMEGRFELTDAAALKGKHVLLVDDVVTTGATLEACGRTLLEAEGVQLSVATLCFSSGN